MCETENNIEKFESNDIVNSCHFVCQNLTTINILLIIIFCILGFMFIEQTFQYK